MYLKIREYLITIYHSIIEQLEVLMLLIIAFYLVIFSQLSKHGLVRHVMSIDDIADI